MIKALKNRFTGVIFAYSPILATNSDMLEGELDPVTRTFRRVDVSEEVKPKAAPETVATKPAGRFKKAKEAQPVHESEIQE